MKRTNVLTAALAIVLSCTTMAYSGGSSDTPSPGSNLLHPVTPATVGTGNGCLRIMPKGMWYFLTPISYQAGDRVLDGTDTLPRRNGDNWALIPRLRMTGGLGHGWEFTGIIPLFYSTHSDDGDEFHGNLGDLSVAFRREVFRKGGFAFGASAGFDLPTGETDGNNIKSISNEQWKVTVELGSTYFWGDLERNRFDITYRVAQPLGEGADDWQSGYMHRVGLAYAYAVNNWLDIGYEAYWMKLGSSEWNDQDMNDGSEFVWHGPKVALKNVIPLRASMLALQVGLPAYQWADGNNRYSPQANFAPDYQISLKFGFLF